MNETRDGIAMFVSIVAIVTTLANAFISWGQHKEFKRTSEIRADKMELRLDRIEERAASGITRPELEAQFRVVHHDMRSLSQTVTNLFDLVKQALEGDK